MQPFNSELKYLTMPKPAVLQSGKTLPLLLYSTIAKLVTSNLMKKPVTTNICFQLQPSRLAYCSLRNSGYKQEKKYWLFPVIFLWLKSSGVDNSNLAIQKYSRLRCLLRVKGLVSFFSSDKI